MKRFIGKKLTLKELPQLRFDTPAVTVGKKYEIVDVEGSNFWLIDDEGNKTTFGSSRFDLETLPLRQKAIQWWNSLGNNPAMRLIKQGELTTKHHSFDRKPSSLTGREIQNIMESEAIEWWDQMNFKDQFFQVIEWVSSQKREFDTTELHPETATRENIAEMFCFFQS